MNTINNKQINPGNRVDFSRIRKYKNPSTPLNVHATRLYKSWDDFVKSWDTYYDSEDNTYYTKFQNRLYQVPNDLTSSAMYNRSWFDVESLENLISKPELVKKLGIIKTSDGKYIWKPTQSSKYYSEIGTDGLIRYAKTSNGAYVADNGLGNQEFNPLKGWVVPATIPSVNDNSSKVTTEQMVTTNTNHATDGTSTAHTPSNEDDIIDGGQYTNTDFVVFGKKPVENAPYSKISDTTQVTTNVNGTEDQNNTSTVASSDTADPGEQNGTTWYSSILPPIKPYRPAPMGNYHLGQIYANNMNSLNEREKHALKVKTPKRLPQTYYAYTTSGYLQQQQLKQELADQRAKYLNSAMSNDIDKSMAAALKFEQEVAPQYNNAITNSIDQHIQNSTREARNAAEKTLDSQTTTANYNNAQDALQTQLDANTREKYTALRAGEKASYLQNQATVESVYNTNENKNFKQYNDSINHFIYTSELNKINEWYRTAMSWDNTVAKISFIDPLDSNKSYNFEQFQNYVLTTLANDDSSADLRTAVQGNDVVALREALESSDNPVAQAFLKALKQKFPNIENEYMKQRNKLDNDYNYVKIYSNRDYSNAILGGQGLDYNLSKIYPGYVQTKKKGGKLKYEDRLIKYLEHNRKVQEDNNKNLRHSSTQAEKRLLRDLDALDRETLLLLRSIFK